MHLHKAGSIGKSHWYNFSIFSELTPWVLTQGWLKRIFACTIVVFHLLLIVFILISDAHEAGHASCNSLYVDARRDPQGGRADSQFFPPP